MNRVEPDIRGAVWMDFWSQGTKDMRKVAPVDVESQAWALNGAKFFSSYVEGGCLFLGVAFVGYGLVPMLSLYVFFRGGLL